MLKIQDTDFTQGNFPAGWTQTSLGNIIDLIIDHRGLTPKKLGGDRSKFGYRAISGKSIKNGCLVNEEKMNLLSDNLYKKWMKEEIQYGDIFLTSEAPLGEHTIWKSNEKLVLSQRIFGIRTDKEKLDPFYFNYFIDSPYYQHELKSKESGSTVSGIKQSELIKTKIVFPPLLEQQTIASILGSLDDKIELLREQNKTLEAVGQAIFKSRFVDFDGVTEFEDSELGPIPKGWKVGKLGDVMTINTKSIHPNRFPDVKFYHYSIPAFDQYFMPLEDKGLTIQSNKTKILPHTILVSKLNPQDKQRIWPVKTSLDDAVSSTEFINYVVNKIDAFEYFYYYLQESNFYDQFVGMATGSTGSRQRTNPTQTLNLEIVIPSVDSIKNFRDLIATNLELISTNKYQIQSLIQTRDSLLPRLMNGKVRVI